MSAAPLDRFVLLSLLRDEFGDVEIGDVEALGRGNVWRVAVAGAPDERRSVVAKREGRDPTGFLDDLAALRMLSPTGVGPRVLAASLDPPLIVMEDLPGRSLADHLLANDPDAARSATTQLAVALATMHGSMIERTDEYADFRRGLGPARQRRLHHRPSSAVTLADRMADARIEPPAGLAGDLERVDELIERPGPYRTYIHGDPCPDNTILAESARLIDFEWGGIGHALLDAVYLEVPFPTCWCYGVIPDAVTSDFEVTYRTHLARWCPAATDDASWERHLTAASASWWLAGIDEFLAPAFDQDSQWGTASLRQRVLHRTTRLAHLAARTHTFVDLGSVAERLLEQWTATWNDLDELDSYPAFQ